MLAKLMGLPIAHLFAATNENDVMHRFFSSGVFRVAATVTPTVSPAMDIGVSAPTGNRAMGGARTLVR